MAKGKDLNPFNEHNPLKRARNRFNTLKDYFKKPKIDTSAQDEMLRQQNLARAELDEEENLRRKRFLSASAGVRAYRGSVLARAPTGNRAGSRTPSVTGGVGGAAGPDFSGGGTPYTGVPF